MGILSGTKVELEITHATAGSVRVVLTYRWWTSDADPWTARVAGMLGANNGTWYPRILGEGPTLYGTGSGGKIVRLRGVGEDSQPFKNGQKGDGEHFGVGGK